MPPFTLDGSFHTVGGGSQTKGDRSLHHTACLRIVVILRMYRIRTKPKAHTIGSGCGQYLNALSEARK
eukprot:6199809-Pleurochrysis_carterae.AAC.1